MDSCHLFNFLFGTKKATSEIGKRFTSVVTQQKNEQTSSDSQNKKIKSKKTCGNVFTNPIGNLKSDTANKLESTQDDNKTQAPLSPLKQFQIKIVQSFTASSASFSSAQKYPKTNPLQNENPLLHETNVSCDAKSGTYHATLVETVEDDEEEEEGEEDYVNGRLNTIEIVENPASKLLEKTLIQESSSSTFGQRKSDTKSSVHQKSIEKHQQPVKVNDGFLRDAPKKCEAIMSETTMKHEHSEFKLQPVKATKFKRIVLYNDDDDCKENHQKEDGESVGNNNDDQKTFQTHNQVYNVISDNYHQASIRGKLEKIDSLISNATNTSQNNIAINEYRESELRSLRDKRNDYVQSLVQSIELNGSFEQSKNINEAHETIRDNNNNSNNFPSLNTGNNPIRSNYVPYNKPITFVKPQPPKTPPKTNKAKCLNIQLSLNKPTNIDQLFKDEKFLIRFFDKLEPLERCVAAQVCRLWRNILYSNQNYWKDLINVIDCSQMRREHVTECIVNTLQSAKLKQQLQQQNHKALTSVSIYNDSDKNNNNIINAMHSDGILNNFFTYKDCSQYNIDPEDVWRIQDLCNRFTNRTVSQQQHHSKQQVNTPSTGNIEQANQATQENIICTTSKSSSIPSQISSTLSSFSLSSLLSPLSESSRVESIKEKLYISLDDRGFDAICLFGATDDDIDDLIAKLPANSHKRILVGRLKNCFVSNKGLELFITAFNHIEELELSGCNELTNSFELTALTNLKRLIITDCINIADGFAQKLIQIIFQLNELIIQAYHMTDSFLEYLSLNSKIKELTRLELPNCKEITNRSLLTIAKHFPQLQILSLSGSTKVSSILQVKYLLYQKKH